MKQNQEFTEFSIWAKANKDLCPAEPGPLFIKIINSLPDHKRDKKTIKLRMLNAYKNGEFLTPRKPLGQVHITDDLLKIR